MRKLLLLITIVIIATGCDRQKVFEQFYSIPGHKWASKEPVVFNVNIDDTASSMNVMISIRNTGQYQFSNLYLFVTAFAPDGSQITDTTEIILADTHGKWLGKGSAAVYTLYHPFRENIRFSRRGIYRFRLEQAMWVKELEHISDVGLRIEKTGSK